MLAEMGECNMADERLDLPATAKAPRRVTIQPGAKYYTLRYLLAAFLAEGESRVHNPALSDDTAVLVQAIRALGGQVTWERDGDDRWSARITGCGGRPSV